IEALKASGTEDQRRRFFAAALAGERFANAIAERGTERADIRKARLQQAGDGFLLNGTKYYSTGALTADWVAVLAADPDDNQAFVLVPAGSPGLERHDDWRGFGQRSSTSGTTVLKDVRVSAEQVLPRPAPDAALNLIGPGTQLVHAAIDTGIARGALDDGTAFIRDRARPWREANVARAAEEPHVIVHVGKLATRVTAAEALLGWAADTLDQIRAEPLTEASVTRAVLAVDQTKAFAAEVSLQVASEILELAGSSATDAGHGLDRHWRNARTHTLHDPARWKFHHVGAWLLSGEQPPFAPA
ncbi:MAG: acyl-CoA dehydrogenase family protein, partial [Solirubrobacterales bacterium]|nr:acyl-CoA dehydrogenase family protein [Solirubrobacterales bacterium]